MNEKDKVTIYDISKRLNISAATVSRALNNSPKISLKTRELVMTTAKEMNYKQNRLALALKSGKTNKVAVVIPFINRNFFSSVIRGIEEKLAPLGYHIIICQTHEDVQREIEQVNALLDTQVDGIFLSTAKTTQGTDHIQNIKNSHTPLIFFDRTKEVSGVSSVTIDDYKAGFQATEHLIRQGCRRIAHISGDLQTDIYKNRYNGYRDALKANGIKWEEKYMIEGSSKLEMGISAVNQLWNLEEKPDAIFAASDFTAMGAIQELQRRKIAIPKEVCVVGFSNEPFTKYLELSLTSVDQKPQEMGKIAAEVFLEQVNGDKTVSIQKKVVLTPELIIRKSSNRA